MALSTVAGRTFDDLLPNQGIWEDISQENIQEINIPYKPRPFQAVLHLALKRFNLLVCHRRFGKTVFAIMEMIDRGLRNDQRNPQYAYVAPTYGQAKKVAWEYLKYYCSFIPGSKANEADLRIDIERDHPEGGKDKIRFMLLGAENPDSLRGIYLDGCILDEFAQCAPSLWGEVIRPALSDRKGWAIFIGTPKGQNHFYVMKKQFEELVAKGNDKYYVAVYKASQTGVLDEEELADARATMSPEEYEQEYECSFAAALVGSYYSKYLNDIERAGRILDFEIDKSIPVRTAWDLGIGDTTAIWMYQVVGREIRIIDYIEENGRGLEFYALKLQERGYLYAPYGHTLPHDAKARELGSGKTRVETLEEYGIRSTVLEKHSLEDGIHAVRQLLQNPNLYFHGTNCARGLEALRNYVRQFDKLRGEFLNKPKHNWASNGSDGFRYLALDLELPQRASMTHIDPRLRQAQTDYNEFDY